MTSKKLPKIYLAWVGKKVALGAALNALTDDVIYLFGGADQTALDLRDACKRLLRERNKLRRTITHLKKHGEK